MNRSVDRLLSWAGLVCILLVVLPAPWLFGAWEMWWFWPLFSILSLGTVLFGVRLFLRGKWPRSARRRLPSSPLLDATSAAALLFLLYAAVRMFQAEVRMDAERSFLLFLSPVLIGVQIAYGCNAAQRRVLLTALLVNIGLLGLYGLINHAVTGSARVMWASAFPQYLNEGRASGSYYCPDHFAGAVELGFCGGLALLLDRRTRWPWRMGAVCLIGIGAIGVILSKSRGGGLTLMVLLAAAPVVGLSSWQPRRRRLIRVLAFSAAAAALVLFALSDAPYMTRFKAYFRVDRLREAPPGKRLEILSNTLQNSSRGRMIGGALRAWTTRPIFGIGPGMHQHLWPRFAASPDGDVEEGIWPTRTSEHFHSYEVHSDWVQLLQEYGVVGLALLLVPAGLLFAALWRLARDAAGGRLPRPPLHAAAVTGLLALVAMAFHSLGDFNLQIPATTWMLAALVALPLLPPDPGAP